MKKAYIPSFQCESALRQLGENLRMARLRRKESEALAAERIGIARATFQRLEKGDPAVAAGAWIDALLTYGFEQQVFALGNPDEDEVGVRLERLMLPKRGRSYGK